ncbi:hypothetical protein I3843_03G107700 [Carya illinoinensis]|nr:hypothetical protein I3843_03G107700 [Carya illinoinensis]
MEAVLLRLEFQIIILSCSAYAFAQAANITKSPSCLEECGNNVKIPYPFGIGAGCYISKWLEIVCNESDTFNGKPKPFLRLFNLEVLKIILLDVNLVWVNYPVFTSCTDNASTILKKELAGSPFVFSSIYNSYVAMGCNNTASMWSEDEKVSPGAVCQSPCDHQRISSRNGKIISLWDTDCCTTKLFDSKELEKATDRFNENRMLGQGGQGTVYKGMLPDGIIVAIKKSKIIDERKLEEFINEVVILSRINHRNVVKLLGCCLETEVPLLVYEFIPNGTLSQYLNNQNEEFSPTWDMRLQIATDIVGALFYLHSAASSPIYHRDIKSTNILLDEKYRAKVANFGTSRSIAIDQTHLTTQVQGLFGYLDPEYFQTSQFIEKRDVYSFGVVLIELLTGEKAISSIRTEDSKGLASFFIRSMEENSLFDILDDRVLKEGEKEKRPTMKEVSMELVAIQTMRKGISNLDQQKYEEIENVKTEMYEQWVGSTSTTLTSCVDSGDHGHFLPISS